MFRAISSTSTFWSRGIWTNSVRLKLLTNWFVNLRYFCILVSFASNSSLICHMTSYESLLSKMFLAPSAWAILSLVNIAPYFASLLVTGNLSWTPCFKMSPSREVMTTPAPPLFWVDDLSVRIVQSSSWSFYARGRWIPLWNLLMPKLLWLS